MTLTDNPNPPKIHYAIMDTPPPADTAYIKNKYLNISYATISNAQKLDLYLPEVGKQPYPVIVAIHGGAFMGCDKGDLQIIPMLEGLNHGFAIVSINYRMSGEAKFPALVQDSKAAIRWIKGNGKVYGLNSEKIVAWGGSAGGYLSSMLAVSSGVKELEDLNLGYPEQSCDIQGAVVWYGPTNFLKMDEQLSASGLLPPVGFRHNEPNSPESLLLGDTITRIPEKVQKANPEIYIGSKAPPMLLQHGRKDPVVPVQQSIEFAQKLKQKFGEQKIILEIIENAEHADPAFETKDNIERVLKFIKDHII